MNDEALFELTRPAWQARSNCHPDVIPHVWQEFGDHPVDLFYPNVIPTGARRAAIASVCGPCPVQTECRQWAVDHEVEGFWGGLGQTLLQRERKAQSVTVVIPEIDPRTRKTIGTFDVPGHGTAARYLLHIRGAMADGNPCEACLDAWAVNRQMRHADAYWERKHTESPEEAEARKLADRERCEAARVKQRRGG